MSSLSYLLSEAKNVLKFIMDKKDIYSPIIYNNKCIYDQKNRLKTYNEKVILMSKYISRTDSVIDIGCNIGFFLTEIKKNLNSDVDYLGVDNDEFFIELAKQISLSYNHELTNINFIVNDDTIIDFLYSNIKIFDVMLLLNLPHPYQYTEFLISIIKKNYFSCKKIIVELNRTNHKPNELISIKYFEEKISEFANIYFLDLFYDENGKIMNMYLIENIKKD